MALQIGFGLALLTVGLSVDALVIATMIHA